MIALDQEGEIATIRLSRPERRNAFAIADWRALAATIAAVEARVIVLRSADPAIFSAGADIAEMAALGPDSADVNRYPGEGRGPVTTGSMLDPGLRRGTAVSDLLNQSLSTDPAARVTFREAMRAGIDALATAPAPVIAFVEGGCFGAAVALAAAADIRIAGPAATFATTPAKLGIGYPPTDVARVTSLIGRGQMARMLLSAAPIDANEAARIGLVDLIADDPLPLARAIAANATSAVALLRRTIAGTATDADFDAAFGGTAFADGLATFRARKKLAPEPPSAT